MVVKVVMTPPQRLSVNVTKTAAKRIQETLQTETGPLFVDLAQSYAEAEYYTDRPSKRRSGSRKYSTGFKFKVRPGRGERGFAALPSIQCTNSAEHALSLEHGSQPHIIRTHGGFDFNGRRRLLIIPGPFGNAGRVTFEHAYGDSKHWKAERVLHPGTTGTNITERAIKTAMRRTFPR